MKNLTNIPEFVLHPFQIVVLLTLSRVSHYEEPVFDVIKASVGKGFKEEEKKIESCWFREILQHNINITRIFEQIIQSKYNKFKCIKHNLIVILNFSSDQKQVYIKQGLITLGFVFLGINAGFGNEVFADKHWNLGLMLLLEIIKINRNNAGLIIHKLSNFILTKQNATPYISNMI